LTHRIVCTILRALKRTNQTENTMIAAGTRVSFQYRTHHLLGGELISGFGTITGETIVGTQNAYVIKPDDGDTVHVRCAGVRECAKFVGMVDVDGEKFAHYTGVSL